MVNGLLPTGGVAAGMRLPWVVMVRRLATRRRGYEGTKNVCSKEEKTLRLVLLLLMANVLFFYCYSIPFAATYEQLAAEAVPCQLLSYSLGRHSKRTVMVSRDLPATSLYTEPAS
jgi:hypothetical protein